MVSIQNPKKILILDEPTKGLDSENSDIIYKICEELSTNSLVLIVTHDLYYVSKYGNSIYELRDKSLVDIEKSELSKKMDNKLVTKPLEKFIHNLYFLSDEPKNDEQLLIIKKEGGYYLYSNNRNIDVTIKALDQLDDNYKEIINNDQNKFLLKEIVNDSYRNLNKVKSKRSKYSLLTKFVYMTGLLIGIFFTAFFGIVKPDDKYISVPRNINQLNFDASTNITKYEFYQENFAYLDIMIGSKNNSFLMNVSNNRNISVKNVFIYPVNIFESIKLLTGKPVLNKTDVIIDIGVINNYLNKDIFYGIGIKNYLDLINQKISIQDDEYTIVGVSNYNKNVIFMDSNRVTESYSFPVRPLSDFDSTKITIIEGEIEVNKAPDIYAYTNRSDLDIGDIVDLNYLNYDFSVQISAKIDVENVTDDIFIISNSNYQKLLLKTEVADLYIITEDNNIISQIESNAIGVINLYEMQVNQLRNSYGINLLMLETSLIVLLVISLFLILYMSYLIKDSENGLIGIKLLLGYNRKAAAKGIFMKIISMILAYVGGYIVGFVIIVIVDSSTNSSLLHVNYDILLNMLVLAGITLLNIIVALIPQVRLMYAIPIEYLRLKNVQGEL